MNKLLNAEEAQSVVQANYDIQPIVYCMLIERGFNDTYQVVTENSKYIFRVYSNNKYFVQSDSAYKFETELLEHLHANGVPVAKPIRTRQHSLISHVATEYGERTVAMFDYAEGMNISRKAITLKQAYNYGAAMANLHLAADSFETKHDRYSLDQKYLIDEPLRLIEEGSQDDNASAEIKELAQHGQRILEKLQPLESHLERINRLGKDDDKFGIIHADLHTGNVHFHGETLTLFDFDHCAYGWRAYDLAIAYNVPKAHRDAVYAGYESKRVLSDEERDSIQAFANLRNLWDIGDLLATVDMRAVP